GACRPSCSGVCRGRDAARSAASSRIAGRAWSREGSVVADEVPSVSAADALSPTPAAKRGRLGFWIRLIIALTLAVVLLRTSDFRAALATLATTNFALVAVVVVLA